MRGLTQDHTGNEAQRDHTPPPPGCTTDSLCWVMGRQQSPCPQEGTHTPCTVFYGCSNQPPHTWWLKMTQMYYLTIQFCGSEVQDGLPGLPSRRWQGCICFWKLWGRIHFLALSRIWRPPTLLAPGWLLALLLHPEIQQCRAGFL